MPYKLRIPSSRSHPHSRPPQHPVITTGTNPPVHHFHGYEQRSFVLPTDGLTAILSPTLGCDGCGMAKRTTSYPPKLASLGDDSDSNIFDTSGLSPIESAAIGLGPTDTSGSLPAWYGTGQLETVQSAGGYAPNPGSYGTAQPLSTDAITNAILNSGAQLATTAINANAAQNIAASQAKGNILAQQVPGLGGISYGTIALVVGGILLVVLLKKR